MVGVGCDLRNKDIMESPRSRQFKQLNSLIVEVTVGSMIQLHVEMDIHVLICGL